MLNIHRGVVPEREFIKCNFVGTNILKAQANKGLLIILWGCSTWILLLSQRSHLMDVDIPYQTGSGGKGTLNRPFYV